MLLKLTEALSSLQEIWADGTRKSGVLVDWVRDTLNIALDVAQRPPGQKGLRVLPRRWVVERTFGWLGRYRRLRAWDLHPPVVPLSQLV